MNAISMSRPVLGLVLFSILEAQSPSAHAGDNLFQENIRNFSSNLPLMHVHTGRGVVNRDSEIPVKVTLQEAPSNNSLDLLRSPFHLNAKFQIRGNSSMKFAKKQYDLELVDSENPEKDAPASLLGLPKHHKWVLAAPYSDRSLIRNSFGLALARSLKNTNGEEYYASRTRPIELFLNGKYQGVYVLTEKIDGGKERLRLGKVNWENPEQSPFLVKVEKTKTKDPHEFFTTEFKNEVTYSEPKAKNFLKQMKVDPQSVREMKKHIQGTMARFERAIKAIEKGDTKTYRQLIDITSFQNFMLVHEVMKNIDGYRRSIYVHYKNGKLHLGPVWDFDLAMANLKIFGQMKPKGFQVGHNFYIDFNRENFWFRTLLKDPVFYRDYVRRYRELRRSGQALSTRALLNLIDEQAEPLKTAQGRNFSVWDYNGRFSDGPVILFVPKYRNYQHALNILNLKQWLLKRLEWLDEHFDEIGDEDDFVTASDRSESVVLH